MGRHQNSYSKEERIEIVLTALRKAALKLKFNFNEKDYTAAKDKIPFTCAAGHKFKTLPTTVIKGHDCLKCSRPVATKKASLTKHKKGRIKYSLEDAKKIASSKGGECLSESYKWKLDWKCKRRHLFTATITDVKVGSWCKTCSRLEPLLKLKKIVKEKKGSFDESKYKTTKVAIEFTCDEGHTWPAKPSAILKGSWCRKCWNVNFAGKHKIVDRLDDAHRIAKERGGECLSDTWVTNDKKLKWKCANNHTWSAVFHDIRKGGWCPTCGKGVRERLCRHYFEQLTNSEFLSVKPEWLLNKNGNRMELDGLCGELSLAFEHQGKQHYQKIDHFNRRAETLRWRLESDDLKRKICKERSITLIEVPYWVKNKDLPEWIANEINSKRPDIKLAAIPLPLSYLASNELSELQQMANSKGGECLSPVYLGVFALHEFRCGKEHTWEAAPANILHSRGVGTWCPTCKLDVLSEANRKYTVKDLQKIAKDRGGKFLSKSFKSVNDPHDWECSEGHQWPAAPMDVMRGKWCRTCSRNASKHSVAVANELAKTRKGNCISQETDYVNSYSYLHWECEKGHRWWARYNNVRNSKSWCVKCKGGKPKHTEKPSK